MIHGAMFNSPVVCRVASIPQMFATAIKSLANHLPLNNSVQIRANDETDLVRSWRVQIKNMPNVGLVLQCSQQFWQIANEGDRFHTFWRSNVIDDDWRDDILMKFTGRRILNVLNGHTHVIRSFDWDCSPNSNICQPTRSMTYAEWYLEVRFICHQAENEHTHVYLTEFKSNPTEIPCSNRRPYAAFNPCVASK